MSNAIERKIMRWIHLVLSIPIIGYIYGPVAERPETVFVTRVFFVPIVILTGLWMWKGHLIKSCSRNDTPLNQWAEGVRQFLLG